jgi:hypothetical protein
MEAMRHDGTLDRHAILTLAISVVALAGPWRHVENVGLEATCFQETREVLEALYSFFIQLKRGIQRRATANQMIFSRTCIWSPRHNATIQTPGDNLRCVRKEIERTNHGGGP